MNFMPSEDAFFDEPLNQPPITQYVPPQVLTQHTHRPAFSHFDHLAKQENDRSAQMLESSKRQEHLLERIVSELEKLNTRIANLERVAPSSSAASTSSRVVSPGASPTNASSQQSAPRPIRGSLVLPPGSRPANIPNLPERKPAEVIPSADDAITRERQEQEAIMRRRAEEEARIARIEAERKQREEEEERKRLEEIKRIEEERKRKEELEKKTRGLMTGLIEPMTSGGGGLFEDDLDLVGKPGKKAGGLFDD